MKSELLIYLVDEAEKHLKDEEFSLNVWHCNTTQCMIGFATTLPRFRELGFTISRLRVEPAFNGVHGWDAVRELFDFDDDHDKYLFSPGWYPPGVKKEEVIARIRKYISNGGCTREERLAAVFSGRGRTAGVQV